MNIIICDDRTEYRKDIESHVALYFSEHDIDAEFFQFPSAEEALVNPRRYDIAFLDIEMNELNGISLAKELKKLNSHIVLFFVTAHNRYLDDALDLNIFRYLNKPLDIERLYKGLDKAIELIDDTIINFYLKTDYSEEMLQIPVNLIVCVEIDGRRTKVITEDNIYYSNEKLAFWKSSLIQTFFYQVHNSFIINMNYVTSYSFSKITLIKKYPVSISQRNRAEFKRRFFSYVESR